MARARRCHPGHARRCPRGMRRCPMSPQRTAPARATISSWTRAPTLPRPSRPPRTPGSIPPGAPATPRHTVTQAADTARRPPLARLRELHRRVLRRVHVRHAEGHTARIVAKLQPISVLVVRALRRRGGVRTRPCTRAPATTAPPHRAVLEHARGLHRGVQDPHEATLRDRVTPPARPRHATGVSPTRSPRAASSASRPP